MIQQVRALAAKSYILHLIPWIQMVNGEKQLLKVFLWPPHTVVLMTTLIIKCLFYKRVCATTHLWRSEDNFQKAVFSYCGFWGLNSGHRLTQWVFYHWVILLALLCSLISAVFCLFLFICLLYTLGWPQRGLQLPKCWDYRHCHHVLFPPFLYLCVWVKVPQHECEGQKTTCGSWFFFHQLGPEIELKPSSLAGGSTEPSTGPEFISLRYSPKSTFISLQSIGILFTSTFLVSGSQSHFLSCQIESFKEKPPT